MTKATRLDRIRPPTDLSPRSVPAARPFRLLGDQAAPPPTSPWGGDLSRGLIGRPGSGLVDDDHMTAVEADALRRALAG